MEKIHAVFSAKEVVVGTIRFFDLFSKIGGFRERLTYAGGFSYVGHCEVDAYADKNYRVLFDTEGEWFCNDARKIETGGIPIKENTKKDYKLAYSGDSIDLGYPTMNSRRGRVGHEVTHTLTTGIQQRTLHFVDLSSPPLVTGEA